MDPLPDKKSSRYLCLIGSDSWLINNSEILAGESDPEINLTPDFKLQDYKSR